MAGEATPSPARLGHSSCQSYLHPPGSRISFPATRPSAGHGVTEPWWEPGSCPACVALPWSSVQPGTSQQDLAAGLAQRSPAGTLQGQSSCSAGILCGPGCAWRSWMGAGEEICSTCWIQSLSLASSLCPQVWMCSHNLSSPQHFHDLESLGTFLPWITSSHCTPGCSRSVVSSESWQRPWKAAWIWDGTRAWSLLFPCKMLLALEHLPPPPPLPVLFQLRMGLCPF